MGKGKSKAEIIKRELMKMTFGGRRGGGGGSGGGGGGERLSCGDGGGIVSVDGAENVTAAFSEVSVNDDTTAAEIDGEKMDETVSTPSSLFSVFVDDSIAGLLDAEVAEVPNLTRVLFSRVLA